MARRSGLSVNDVLQHLDTDDSFDNDMAEGSDDELGMDSVYDYDSDSSVEGIIYQIVIYIIVFNKIKESNET